MGLSKVRFEEILRELYRRENDLLRVKRAQYAEANNCLANFEWQAQAEGRRPEEVCLSLLLKHVCAIVVAIKSGGARPSWEDDTGREGLLQRICDARNYLALLAAILAEKNGG